MISIFICSAIGSFFLAWPVYSLMIRFGIIDKPNERSSHSRPTARGGGIAIMAVVLIGAVFLSWKGNSSLPLYLAGLATILAVVSFVDDIKRVHPKIRLGCHALAAAGSIYLFELSGVSVPIPGTKMEIPSWLVTVLIFFWITGYTNAFNFMDGINGIAGFQALITGLGMVIIVLAGEPFPLATPLIFSSMVAGAALGFLPHNFPRARMFMGDVSSAPLGFLLAVCVVRLALAHHGGLLIPLALLHANFVLDTGFTLLRRMFRGEKWYLPHREHFYQRLIRAGRSHSFVTGCEIVLQLVTLFLMLIYVTNSSSALKVMTAGGVLALWSLFFAYAEFSFRKASLQEIS